MRERESVCVCVCVVIVSIGREQLRETKNQKSAYQIRPSLIKMKCSMTRVALPLEKSLEITAEVVGCEIIEWHGTMKSLQYI